MKWCIIGVEINFLESGILHDFLFSGSFSHGPTVNASCLVTSLLFYRQIKIMAKLLPLFHEKRDYKLSLFKKWKGFYSWFSLDRMEKETLGIGIRDIRRGDLRTADDDSPR